MLFLRNSQNFSLPKIITFQYLDLKVQHYFTFYVLKCGFLKKICSQIPGFSIEEVEFLIWFAGLLVVAARAMGGNGKSQREAKYFQNFASQGPGTTTTHNGPCKTLYTRIITVLSDL